MVLHGPKGGSASNPTISCCIFSSLLVIHPPLTLSPLLILSGDLSTLCILQYDYSCSLLFDLYFEEGEFLLFLDALVGVTAESK